MCVCSSQPTSVYITGYGIDTEYPEKGLEGVEQLQPNQYITLVEGEDQEHNNNWDKIKLTGVGWGGVGETVHCHSFNLKLIFMVQASPAVRKCTILRNY